MAKYKCMMCGYVYDEAKGDPDNGIPAGTKWEDLPAGYACPVCASPKGQFKKIEDQYTGKLNQKKAGTQITR